MSTSLSALRFRDGMRAHFDSVQHRNVSGARWSGPGAHGRRHKPCCWTALPQGRHQIHPVAPELIVCGSTPLAVDLDLVFEPGLGAEDPTDPNAASPAPPSLVPEEVETSPSPPLFPPPSQHPTPRTLTALVCDVWRPVELFTALGL